MKKETIKTLLLYIIFIAQIYIFFPNFSFSNGLFSIIGFILKFLIIIFFSAFITNVMDEVLEAVLKFCSEEYPRRVEGYYSFRYKLNEYRSDSGFWRSLFTGLSHLLIFRKAYLFSLFRHLSKYKLPYIIFFIFAGGFITIAIILLKFALR